MRHHIRKLKKNITTEYCCSSSPNSLEFHRGKYQNRYKTLCSSVTSVVVFLFIELISDFLENKENYL